MYGQHSLNACETQLMTVYTVVVIDTLSRVTISLACKPTTRLARLGL